MEVYKVTVDSTGKDTRDLVVYEGTDRDKATDIFSLLSVHTRRFWVGERTTVWNVTSVVAGIPQKHTVTE